MTIIEQQAYHAQIDTARQLKRIADALEALVNLASSECLGEEQEHEQEGERK